MSRWYMYTSPSFLTFTPPWARAPDFLYHDRKYDGASLQWQFAFVPGVYADLMINQLGAPILHFIRWH